MRTIRSAGESAARRGTVHGSPHKAALSRIGGRVMKRDSKPDGFIVKAAVKPDRGRP